MHTRNTPTRSAGLVGRPRSFLLGIIVSLLVLSGAQSYASGQTPTPTPSEEELKLQEQKRLIELQRDIELAKKAIRDATATPTPTPAPTPPQPTATPLAGDTTLDAGVRFEISMVAYRAMSQIADNISKELYFKLGSASNYAIYDAQTIRDWRFHQSLFPAFQGQTDDIRKQYLELLCEAFKDDTSQAFKDKFCITETASLSPQRKAVLDSARAAGVSEAFGAGATLIKSFIDIAALFRTDTKIEGATVDLDDSALIAEVFRALEFRCRRLIGPPCPSLYNPAAFHPRLEKSDTVFRVGQLFVFKTEADRIIKDKTAGRPTLVNQLNELGAKKGKAEETLEKILDLRRVVNNLTAALANETVPQFRKKLWEERDKVEVQLSTLSNQAELEAEIARLEVAIAAKKAAIKAIDEPVKALTDLNDRFQKFVDQFIKTDEKGSNTLAMFIKSEDIERIMGNKTSYWIEIKSIAAGGNNRTRKNLIWFFLGPRVDHSGGVIAEYTIYDNTGAVVTSDKIAYYEGYKEPKKIQNGKLPDVIPSPAFTRSPRPKLEDPVPEFVP